MFGFFVFLIGFLPKRNNINDVKRILIIKLWAVGDAVVSLPLIEGIRKNYPDAKIDVLSFRNNAFVYENKADEVFQAKKISKWPAIVFPKFKKYDLVFDEELYLNISALTAWWMGKFRVGFANQLRSRIYNKSVEFSRERNMVQNYLEMLRGLGKHFDTGKLVPLHYDKELAKKFKAEIGQGIIVGINPGISESVKSRMWPLERMAEVIAQLLKMDLRVIIVDGPDNRENVNNLLIHLGNDSKKVVDFTGKTNWKQTVALISACDLFIANDTGPMHVAAAQGVKTIGLFGPNVPSLWKPYGKNNVALYHRVHCSP